MYNKTLPIVILVLIAMFSLAWLVMSFDEAAAVLLVVAVIVLGVVVGSTKKTKTF